MPIAASTLATDMVRLKADPDQVIRAFMDILAGVEALHALGMHHRDLKPQNVLKLNREGHELYAISDFGLLALNDTLITVLTVTGMRMGSDMYTAPEIVADLDEASVQSDIYSLGCMLHDLVGVGGRRIPCNQITGDTSAYKEIISICTREEPKRRFPSVAMLRDAVLAVDVSQHATAVSGALIDLANLLEGADDIALEVCHKLWDEIRADHEGAASALFTRFNLNKVNQLISLDPVLARRVGVKYSQWAAEGVFNWGLCDGLADRLESFYKMRDTELSAEVLLALLRLGTSHNRWYVESKFVRLCNSTDYDNVLRRFVIEMRILGVEDCRRMFYHLEKSIKADLSTLPTIIIEFLSD